MIQRLKDWWERLFHKAVTLEPFNEGYMLWVEKRDVGWSIYIPSDCLLFLAKQLNEVTKVNMSYKLGVISTDSAEFIHIPKWAFNEARRLITLEALKEVKE